MDRSVHTGHARGTAAVLVAFAPGTPGVVDVGLTRHRWPWAAAVLIGAAQVGWITLELVYLPQAFVLQAIYGTNGLLLLAAPMLPAARRYFAISSTRPLS